MITGHSFLFYAFQSGVVVSLDYCLSQQKPFKDAGASLLQSLYCISISYFHKAHTAITLEVQSIKAHLGSFCSSLIFINILRVVINIVCVCSQRGIISEPLLPHSLLIMTSIYIAYGKLLCIKIVAVLYVRTWFYLNGHS